MILTTWIGKQDIKVTKETMILEFSENILIKLICSYNKIYKNHMQQSVH